MPEGIAAVASHLPWAIYLPLGAALFHALFGARLPRALIGTVAVVAIALDFALACEAFVTLRANVPGTSVLSAKFVWLDVAPLFVSVRLMADALSVLMWLIVTGFGLLIHLYSVSYQRHAPSFGRYFAWLNFFVAMMLVLVLADALPIIFLGWEGVGLASWALIGFAFAEPAKVAAGKKAFVVNRIGDAGFLLAMFLLFANLGTLNLVDLRAALAAGDMNATALGAAAFLLALAACGKSAQLPLYVWLPDAMAGPTPVSALIHAATMVTAGVYLLTRMGFVLATSQLAMATVALTGAVTALFAALSALGQTDLKKCLAYSTVSQLGYMFVAVGLGAAPLALVHVTTHAGFKACLFLAAGSVIHAAAGEQDMLRLGRLGAVLPRIAWPAGVAVLAISGLPPLSGFVSKDAILAHALAASQSREASLQGVASICLVLGLVTALLTAVYMGRWYVWTFWTPTCRLPKATQASLHDAPPLEAAVLAVLAVASIVLGALNWPHLLGGHERFVHWLAGNGLGAPLGGNMVLAVEPASALAEWLLMATSTGLAVAGLAYAYWRHGRTDPSKRPAIASFAGGHAMAHAFGYEQAASRLVVTPYAIMAKDVLRHFERRITSSFMLVLGHSVRLSAWAIGTLHNGNLQRSLALFALAMALLLWTWLLPHVQASLFGMFEGLA